MRSILILILITFISQTAYGQKVSSLQKGEKAPFTGILLDREAEARISSKKATEVRLCEADKEYKLEKLKAECGFNQRVANIQKEKEKKVYDELLRIKTERIKSLQSYNPNLKIWWALGGFVSGVGISLGIYKIAIEVSK